jgi:hypothetical protein
VLVSLMADSDDEGGAAQQRAGNIEGALTAKGDGQILQQRMAAERLRKQDEMARAALRKADAAAERADRVADPTYTRALGRAGSRADAFSQPAARPAHTKKAGEGKEWVYIDANKKHQGPFTLSQMQQWYAAGYLPDSTEVKHQDDAEWTTVGQQSRIYVAASVGTSQPVRRHTQAQRPQPYQPYQHQQQQQQQQQAFQSCTHTAFTPGCPCCMAYAQPQQQQAAGYGGHSQPAMQAGNAAAVAREVASGAAGAGGPGTGANAPGVAGGGVKKKKKEKKKLGNAVSTRAMPSFKAARSTTDLWKAPSGAGINLF